MNLSIYSAARSRVSQAACLKSSRVSRARGGDAPPPTCLEVPKAPGLMALQPAAFKTWFTEYWKYSVNLSICSASWCSARGLQSLVHGILEIFREPFNLLCLMALQPAALKAPRIARRGWRTHGGGWLPNGRKPVPCQSSFCLQYSAPSHREKSSGTHLTRLV